MARAITVLALTALATGLGSLTAPKSEASPAPSTSPTSIPVPTAAPVQAAPVKQLAKRCWYYVKTKSGKKVKRWTTCKQTKQQPKAKPAPRQQQSAPKPQPQWRPQNNCHVINGVAGGTRPGHRAALDYMTTDPGVAQTAIGQMRAGQCSIEYVISRQTIYFPDGSSQRMADRGSITENHFDHTHVEYRGR
jgi:hypothetical protein